MGKAAAAAAGAVAAGMASYVALSALVPASWAQGSALVLTGLGLLGASRWLEARAKPRAQTPTSLAPVPQPIRQAQEA